MYSPKICSVTSFLLSLVYNTTDYQIHGLWPEVCKECKTCGYPSCCQIYPNSSFQQTQFIKDYWLDGLNPTKLTECNTTTFRLYEHEAIKHGSCMGLNTNDYVLETSKVFYRYQNSLQLYCQNKTNCDLYLDANYNIVKIIAL